MLRYNGVEIALRRGGGSPKYATFCGYKFTSERFAKMASRLSLGREVTEI